MLQLQQPGYDYTYHYNSREEKANSNKAKINAVPKPNQEISKKQQTEAEEGSGGEEGVCGWCREGMRFEPRVCQGEFPPTCADTRTVHTYRLLRHRY